MGNEIFNTLLVKGENKNKLAEIKSSLIDINEKGEKEIILSRLKPVPPADEKSNINDKTFEYNWKIENWGITHDRWNAEYELDDKFLLIRFGTKNLVPTEWLKKIVSIYSNHFFILTSSSVYTSSCLTCIGLNGATYDFSVPVFELDNERQPFYYDSNFIPKYFNSNEIVPNELLGGRCFRNPITLLIDVLVKNNLNTKF